MGEAYTVRAMLAPSGPAVILTGSDGRRWIARDSAASDIAEAYHLPLFGEVRIAASVDADGMLHLADEAPL
jgi:hypothetical protein